MQNNVIDNLVPLLPELYLTAATLLILLFGVLRIPRVTPMLLLASLLAIAFTMVLVPQTGTVPVIAMNGMFRSDGFTALVKLLILGGTALTLLISTGWLLEEGGKPFEYLLLVLFAVLGMMLMVSAQDLLAVYVGLELSSLSLYVLASFNRDDTRSTEAGLKYFVLGALASGMLLFGISLIYGFAGSTGFDALTDTFAAFGDEAGGNAAISRVITIGLVLMIVGFCFKISAVPFHMWTPDVYEGAPTPVTAFFAIAPKIAAFALFTRLLLQPFADLLPQWQQIIIFVSIASMLVGALAALRQTNIKRLLAYSSIGHAGFMLMGLAAGTSSGVQGMLIYFAVYLFMSAGAFGCVLMMRRNGVYVETIADLAGLSRSQPGLALAFAAFMFSMAGIPPLAGFFGKMYVVMAAIEAKLVPLAVVGLVTSVISCYYYLRVVKFMYFDTGSDVAETDHHHGNHSGAVALAAGFDRNIAFGTQAGIAIAAFVTLFFFLMPSPLVSQARAAAAILLH